MFEKSRMARWWHLVLGSVVVVVVMLSLVGCTGTSHAALASLPGEHLPDLFSVHTLAQTEQPVEPDQEQSFPWWWLLALPVLLLLLLLVWLVRRKKPDVKPSEPPLPNEPKIDRNRIPEWVEQGYKKIDRLVINTSPWYEYPDFRDTLIIGVGEVGSRVLEAVHHEIEQRFAGYGKKRNVRLLYIDVQPKDVSAPLPTPATLPPEYIARLEPDYTQVSRWVNEEPEKYQHLQWWRGNSPDDYGRAGGRMALFYDLRNTQNSVIWGKLKNVFAELPSPRVAIVAPTFDNIGSGMVIDLARIVTLIDEKAQRRPLLFLALPSGTWQGPNPSDQQAQSVAMLRELRRFLRNADFPFVYNPYASQQALNSWLVGSSPLEWVYLFDGARHASYGDRGANVRDVPDRSDLITQDMIEALLTLIELNVEKSVSDFMTPSVTKAGTSNQEDEDKQSIGGIGTYTLYLPIEEICRAMEYRAVHEVLFHNKMGLIPAGHFNKANQWQMTLGDGGWSNMYRNDAAQQVKEFLENLEAPPERLLLLTPNQAEAFRRLFLARLQPRIDTLLNGDGSDSTPVSRSGGLLRALAFTKELLGRLAPLPRREMQQCKQWTAQLQSELQTWLTALIGSELSATPENVETLASFSSQCYATRRRKLEELRRDVVTIQTRDPLLSNDLELPFYTSYFPHSAQQTIHSQSPISRILSRMGWWCQPPAGEHGWQIRLIILPPEFPDAVSQPEKLSKFIERCAYSSEHIHEIVSAVQQLTKAFSDQIKHAPIGKSRVTDYLDSYNVKSVPDYIEPGIEYSASTVQVYEKLLLASVDNKQVQVLRNNLKTAVRPLDSTLCATNNPYRCGFLNVVYPIPLNNTAAYGKDAQYHYYTSKRLHVFPAEQYVVDYEPSNERFPPKIVNLFASEIPDLMHLLGLCWIYGLLTLSDSATEKAMLTLSDGKAPDPVLQVPGGDALSVFTDMVSSRHQQSLNYESALSQLSPTHRAETLERIKQAIDRERRNIWQQGNHDKLRKFQETYVAPLQEHAEQKHLARFLSRLIDEEEKRQIMR
jgi:hypothetical protein